MSWLDKLHHAYENAMLLDISEVDKPIPIGHTIQNAHVNIVIDNHGEFRRAEVFEKTPIVLPATEKSAGRSSGEAPHPLADKLQYVGGDYSGFGGLKKSYFQSYYEQLEEWSNSEFTHPHVVAVLRYVSKKSVIADLIRHNIVFTGVDGKLLTEWVDTENEPGKLIKSLPKVAKVFDQGNALVCWTVERPGEESSETWKDKKLQQCWTDFSNSDSAVKALCYVTGEYEPVALSHSAKLRHSGDKAKLISANDLAGFTFRGRFNDNKASIGKQGYQAATVGSTTSQKAHNALRWLIGRQECLRNNDQRIVAFSGTMKPIPSLDAATVEFDLFDFGEDTTADVSENSQDSVSAAHVEEEINESVNHGADLGARYAKNLGKLMAGYRADVRANDSISILGLDSATPGRMSITYYRETVLEEFIDQVTRWHQECAWFQRVSNESFNNVKEKAEKSYWPISAPSPNTIMYSIYGDVLKSNKALKSSFYDRIIPCIVEGQAIPNDFVSLCISQASRPNGKPLWEWERSVGVACALYRGWRIRHPDINQRKEISMGLDVENTSRDYLYGRLLALAEHMERTALYAASVERPTTALRLMQRFCDYPYTTWLTIYKQLQPYVQQLRVRRAGFLYNMESELDEVMNAFTSEDFTNDTKLQPEFLLGYHCQRLKLRKKTLDDKKQKAEGAPA